MEAGVPNLKMIAERAHVSPTTVSVILNNRPSNVPISQETRRRVIEIAEAVGYVPDQRARALRTNKSGIIATIVWDIADQFFTEVLGGIEGVLRSTGYRLMVSSADRTIDYLRAALTSFKGIHPDGFLIIGGSSTIVQENLGELLSGTAPVILVGIASQGCSSVTVDNRAGGYHAMTYLARLQHDELLLIGARDATFPIDERLRGARQAIQENLLENRVRSVELEPTEHHGWQYACRLFRGKNVSRAFFAANDRVALGVVAAADKFGLEVPGRVAVTGFDDLSFAAYTVPALTTVRQPRRELGRRGAEMLLRQLANGTRNPEQLALAPELIRRQSA